MNEAVRYINQECNEKRYSRKHIDGYIRAEIFDSEKLMLLVNKGIEMLTEWMNGDYYESKNKRLAQLKGFDIPAIVMDVFVGICYITQEELFTSVTSEMAGRLRFSDKTEAIITTAEIMAVLCQTDAFDIRKASKGASLVIQSNIKLSDKLMDYIEHSQYLPPMVCEPRELTNNFSSGYLTHDDSLILGAGNHHSGDICLDVLNIMNKVELSLDLDFLCKVEEDPSDLSPEAMKASALKKGYIISNMDAELRSVEAMKQWNKFKKHSYRFYDLIQSQGNVFHLCHKVDKRGRIYCSGYHISTQSGSFKKAMIELAKQEYITGVP